ncbi:chemotaxis protein CheW [Desulfobacterota bacterium M19]
MAEEVNTFDKLLNDLALKIMMVDPGDLSVVGDLILDLENLDNTPDITGKFPNLKQMALDLREVLGKIVMTDIDDSAENFDIVGQCIGLMEEIYRKNDNDPESLATFNKLLSTLSSSPAAVENIKDSSPAEQTEATPAAPQSPASTGKAPAAEVPDGPVILDTRPDSLDFMEDMELLSGFIEETREHLESIEVNILDLEDNPGDMEIINNIFRPFHTIKGVSGFLNLTNIQKLAHSTENLLDDVRNNIRTMDESVIEVVLKVGDCLKLMIDNLQDTIDNGSESYKNYDISNYIRWVKRIQGADAVEESAATSPSQTPAPPVQSAESASAAPASTAPPAASTAPGSSPAPPTVSTSDNTATAKPKSKAKKVGATIKVDVDKLDGLVNAVGELVIMQTMVRANPHITAIADPKLNKDFGQLFRITSELQKTSMSMRMVPIRQTFQKMIRLVRDLSKKTGKQANLVMEGEETEIDRNMVDSIYDPLVHMMRNSVDHGVQLPEERIRLGKPSYGTVSLRAYQKGGYMVIEIEDDGQGLNTEKIKRKALERGLIQESDNLSDHDLNNLVFLPGFSTADQITDVSGRGVGMDVVKKAVEKLRGKVDVMSEPGKGSIFTIRLPLTLAIIDGIIVQVGTERYIIPTIAIRESFRPRHEDYKTIKGQGETLLVRGTLVPIIRLYKYFKIGARYTDPCEAIVVVVESEGKQRAIMVDELLGKQEVVIKNLGGITDITGVAGGTILGDGRVGLILDLAGLVTAKMNYNLDIPAAESRESPAVEQVAEAENTADSGKTTESD